MTEVAIRPWADADAPLLAAANTAAMTAFLGGPESDADVAERHARYLRLVHDGPGRPFAIVADGEAVGWVGWWPIERDERAAVETGWFVVERAQRRGVARAAVRLVLADAARSLPPGTRVYASPSVDNLASNALCAAAGFVRVGEETSMYRGAELRSAVWVMPLPPLDPV